MTTQLLIGGDGLVGKALRVELTARGTAHVSTSRKPSGDQVYYNLLESRPETLPDAAVVYLIAAYTTFAACEGNAQSWIANVDAPIAIARYFRKSALTVFVSSDAVEWCGSTAYARQKAQAESYMQSVDAIIMRPSRIGSRAPEFARFMADAADLRLPGVFRWK